MDGGDLYRVVGIIIGVLTFFGCWVYAYLEWGFLLGVGLGWLPSIFIAIIAGFIGPALLLIGLFVFGFLYLTNI